MKSTCTTNIAPVFPLSPADRAAHRAASYVRPPLPVRIPESGLTGKGAAALGRLETWAAYVLADRQADESARREIAEAA